MRINIYGNAGSRLVFCTDVYAIVVHAGCCVVSGHIVPHTVRLESPCQRLSVLLLSMAFLKIVQLQSLKLDAYSIACSLAKEYQSALSHLLVHRQALNAISFKYCLFHNDTVLSGHVKTDSFQYAQCLGHMAAPAV